MTHKQRNSRHKGRFSCVVALPLLWGAALLLCTAALTNVHAQSTQRGKNAASSRCANQERDTEDVKSWRDLYVYYTRYKNCGFNADVAEGISEPIAKLLVNKWSDLPAIGRELRAEQGFSRYVLAGVNSTVDEGDLNTIAQKSREGCGLGLEAFCKSLNARAKQALAESK